MVRLRQLFSRDAAIAEWRKIANATCIADDGREADFSIASARGLFLL